MSHAVDSVNGVGEPLLANALQDLQARYDRLQLLYQVSDVIHSTLEPQQVLVLIMSEAVRIMRASSGSVVLVNPNNNFLEIQASHGLPITGEALQLKLGEGITGWVARKGKSARVGDVRQDPRYIAAKQNVLSELAVPLEVDGEVRGVVNVDSERLNAFTEEDEQLLKELATQAARVIKNTWLYEQNRRKARLFESLFSVGQIINSALNLDDALLVITREACELMEAKMCSLLMLDDSREWLDLRANYGAGVAYLSKPRLSLADSLLGTVVRRKKPLQVQNVQISSHYQNVEIARQEGLVSLLSVPLIYRGNAIGTLSVYTSVPHIFSNEEVRILSALAEMSGIAIEKARLYERLVDVEEEIRQNEKLSAIGLLAAEVAHEIRNPLTVMKMLYHSLNLSFDPADPRARDAQIMGEKMDLLNRIVEQVLDFARTTEPRFQLTDVNRVLDDLGLLIRHKLTNQNIRWVKKLDPELPKIMADPTQLEQVFLNLTLNAVEAMPDGGELVILTRTIKSPGGPQIAIQFKDTGDGMAEEQCAHVFSSLLRTTRRKGTGLGLAIVAKIIEAHHGRIRVRSKVGKGTVFTVALPSVEQGASAQAKIHS
ncbi:MAG: GAF domain-containing protein [Verrucomicrobia bacterium]|nr:GAF domain-containing protein [Verrucomicrobiota bacterium]